MRQVLVFFQMTRMMDIVEDYIEELRGWKCCRIDGSVPLAVRQDQIQLFQSDASIFVFLFSTRSGGQGLRSISLSLSVCLSLSTCLLPTLSFSTTQTSEP